MIFIGALINLKLKILQFIDFCINYMCKLIKITKIKTTIQEFISNNILSEQCIPKERISQLISLIFLLLILSCWPYIAYTIQFTYYVLDFIFLLIKKIIKGVLNLFSKKRT